MSREVAKVKKPANTAFKQQRLKAWQPILTPKTVLPTFFAIGIIFLPIGIGLFIASEQVNQIMFDYTQCKVKATSQWSAPPADLKIGGNVVEWRSEPLVNYTAKKNASLCQIKFRVEQTFSKPVFMYYRLTNFYQNHRRYVKSFDAHQLKGDEVSAGALTTACDPLRSASKDSLFTDYNIPKNDNAQYYPCGLIANSLFSDNINLTIVKQVGSENTLYRFGQKGIAWPSDSKKYGTTSFSKATNVNVTTLLIPPPRWREAFPQWEKGYNSTNLPNLAEWESFQVWMRTAGLPNFRKLYGRNDEIDLPSGVWQLDITDTFDVIPFGGTKSIVISTISIIGGKNPFLGIAYMVVGCICIFLGVIFLIKHLVSPRKLGDHNYLSWNQPSSNSNAQNGAGPSDRPERSALMR